MKSPRPAARFRTTRHAAAWCVVGIASLAFAAEPTTKPAAAPTTQPLGNVTFRPENDPTTWDPKARARIEKAMTEAVAVYNQYSTLSRVVPVVHSPSTPTADASYNGRIRFGGQIGTRTALHELGHIFGVGTAPQWRRMLKDGKWTGPIAQKQLQEFDGPDAVLKGDRHHFWPYGLNFDGEGTSPEQYRRHVLLVVAMRADMGLGPTTAPATPRP